MQKRSSPLEKTLSSTQFAVSFRILGNAAASQNLFTLANLTGSTVTVVIRSLTVEMDATAVLTAFMMHFKVFRTSDVPSAGTVLTEASQDNTKPGSSSVVARGANASDGGVASAITATASGGAITNRFGMRLHTAVGQVLGGNVPINLMPLSYDQEAVEGIVLNANEAIVVQAINATAASNAATNHYIVNCAWDELS